jgi:hypothetical protein
MSFTIYHCGRCGSLFAAQLGHDEARVCGVCQQKPGTGEWPVEHGNADVRESPGSPDAPPESAEGKVHRASATSRRGSPLTWIAVMWVLLMGSSLWLHRHHSRRELEGANRAGSEGDVRQEKSALLAAALPECHRAFLGFLNAGNLEERLQFVADPADTARKMENHYVSNPFPQMDAGQTGRIGQELLEIDGEWVVRTRWQVGGEGDRFDAVFRREDGAWLLDWAHFVRFSDYPWEAFLAGDGPEQGEFRLLAKEIPSTEETERKDRRLRFEFLSPEPGALSDEPVATQQLVVDRLSEEGLLLQAAFAANRQGGGAFGGAMKPLEQDGLVRVRVIVKRIDFGGVRKFEVARIIACHWISSEDPGFDLGKLKDDAFGPS